MIRFLIVFSVILCLFISTLVYAECDDTLNEIWADSNCTKIKTYKSPDISDRPILVVVLHGDSPFNKPGYQYEFAKTVANKSANVVAIGMLRPGYTDTMDRTSDGDKGEANGDSYDKNRVDHVAQAISELKQVYRPSKTILAGHSGGSAITANIISLYPHLIDHAFMVSCPCDVNTWRKDMFALSKRSVFQGDIKTLSPLALVNHINEKTTISMFVGNKDKITKPYINQKYKNAVSKIGVQVTLEVIDGKHDIFLNPSILSALAVIIKSYNAKPENEDKKMKATGDFEIKMDPQQDESNPAGRMTIKKQYSGGLIGTGVGQMISKRTKGTSVYSAIEEFKGALVGKIGGFTLFHSGLMSAAKQELKIIIVEGSGSGDLEGIQGELVITQDNGLHQYELKYSL